MEVQSEWGYPTWDEIIGERPTDDGRRRKWGIIMALLGLSIVVLSSIFNYKCVQLEYNSWKEKKDISSELHHDYSFNATPSEKYAKVTKLSSQLFSGDGMGVVLKDEVHRFPFIDVRLDITSEFHNIISSLTEEPEGLRKLLHSAAVGVYDNIILLDGAYLVENYYTDAWMDEEGEEEGDHYRETIDLYAGDTFLTQVHYSQHNGFYLTMKNNELYRVLKDEVDRVGRTIRLIEITSGVLVLVGAGMFAKGVLSGVRRTR